MARTIRILEFGLAQCLAEQQRSKAPFKKKLEIVEKDDTVEQIVVKNTITEIAKEEKSRKKAKKTKKLRKSRKKTEKKA